MEPVAGARVIEERAARYWAGVDGFTRAQIRHGADFTRADSVAALAATVAFARALPTSVLVDARGIRSADRDSRRFWEGPEARGTLVAMAILVEGPVSRMVATFFVRLVRPDFGLKIFASESDAIAWLREMAP